ncbi:hypothetical protein QYE76_041448 [Lolium multiflorum]|uniref:Uncharacterized protein n=1 Tax=Lolium multiflorum TaxID=4521 RepID=A0AAD8TD32_LOLMU|nr:hypothetical protein QYE76_041448 [Lolium multiflorum]
MASLRHPPAAALCCHAFDALRPAWVTVQSPALVAVHCGDWSASRSHAMAALRRAAWSATLLRGATSAAARVQIGALRYKIRRDDPGDVEGESTPEEGSAKLYLLVKQPSSTISTFQGYEINGNTFYTFAQDKKSTNQNSGVRFDAADDNGKKVTYYGYIEEIWELEYGPNFKVPLFRCKWFN